MVIFSHKELHTLRILPPATPPLISLTSEPGLFTSKERITIMLGGDVKFLSGMGIFFTMYSHITSILYFSCADIGTTGAPWAIVPWAQEYNCNRQNFTKYWLLLMRGAELTCINFWIASCWFIAALSWIRSILFCRMIICWRRMISTAARCSDVWGYGQLSFAAIRSSAPSMIAAPLSIVAMRMSCPCSWDE